MRTKRMGRRAAIARRAGALVAAIACVESCTATESRDETRATSVAITNGTDDAVDPAVVALVDASARVVCTGTLVAPHVVLTAAHCAIGPRNYTDFRAFFGSSPSAGGTFVALDDARIHPGFVQGTFTNDVALVTLGAGVPTTPISMLDRPLDASFVGASARVVGFGSTGDAGSVGTKRQGTATISAVAATTFDLAPSPSQPCTGDSGGPTFMTVGGIEYVAGVTSHGDAACALHDTDTRVDAYRDAFILPYIASVAAGTAGAGARCAYPEQCAGGAPCVTATDEPKIAYCAPACASDAACPAAMSCVRGSCRFPAPTPGAMGSTCSADTDCVAGDCLETKVCSRRCISGSNDCPASFACENVGDIRFYCIATRQIVSVHGPSCVMRPSGHDADPWCFGFYAACVVYASRQRRR